MMNQNFLSRAFIFRTSIPKQKKNQTKNQHAFFNLKTNSKFFMSSSSESSFINDDK